MKIQWIYGGMLSLLLIGGCSTSQTLGSTGGEKISVGMSVADAEALLGEPEQKVDQGGGLICKAYPYNKTLVRARGYFPDFKNRDGYLIVKYFDDEVQSYAPRSGGKDTSQKGC